MKRSMILLSMLVLPVWGGRALAADQEHNARKLDGVRLTTINAAASLMFWDEPTVRVSVDGDAFPDSVHVDQVGSTLEISTGGKGSGVRVFVDDCKGDDCPKDAEGASKVIIMKRNDEGPIDLDLDELDAGDAKAVIIKRFADGDQNADVNDWVDDEGVRHITIKRPGPDGDKEIRIRIKKDENDADVQVINMGDDDIEEAPEGKKKRRVLRRFFKRQGDGGEPDAVLDEQHVDVRVEVEKGGHLKEVPAITVRLPRNLDLKVTTVNGALDVGRGGKGPAKLMTVNGRLSAADFAGKLSANTVAGAIDLQQIDGEVSARSVSGAIDLKGVSGEVDAHTVSGAIHLGQLSADELSARSASGSIEHRGALSKNGKYELKTTSGKITFFLPADAAFDYDIDTLNGSVVGKDFGIPSSAGRIAGTVGKAGRQAPKVTIESLSGQVSFVKE